MFTYIDLFAGCGGLSVGLERAGGKLILAAEKSPMAAETFFRNLIAKDPSAPTWESLSEAPLLDQVQSGLAVGPVRDLLDDEEAFTALKLRISKSSKSGLDVIVGGPPCQGFSLAGRRNPKDQRNTLPWEFLEFVERLTPKLVVIENVVGMDRKFAKQPESAFSLLGTALESTGGGYSVQRILANAMHYGAPQHRPRLILVGLRKDVFEQLGIEQGPNATWYSSFKSQYLPSPPTLAPAQTTSEHSAPTLGDAVCDLTAGAKPTSSANSKKFLKLMGNSELWGLKRPSGDELHNHVFRKHGTRVVARFRLYQALAGLGIPTKVLKDYSAQTIGSDDLRRIVKGAQISYPLVAPDSAVVARNFVELERAFRDLGTMKHSQRVLAWDAPSRTVVTLPDDYVHPIEPRTLTVRELARLQGFPDSFIFYGKETTGAHRRRTEVPQYSQVGNAVSPFLGVAIGDMITKLLDN